MTVTWEGEQFLCRSTRPDIPYTLYVNPTYLLLVPRQIDHIHPNFPALPNPLKKHKLWLSDNCINEYKKQCASNPKFDAKHVAFGLEDDEVVVTVHLRGSNLVPHWEFRSMFKGDKGNAHIMDISSDAEATFGAMQFDLRSSAVDPRTLGA